MVQAMGPDAVDIGGVGDAPPVFAAAGGAKIKIVGARTNPAAAGAVVVPKGSADHVDRSSSRARRSPRPRAPADYHLLTVLQRPA